MLQDWLCVPLNYALWTLGWHIREVSPYLPDQRIIRLLMTMPMLWIDDLQEMPHLKTINSARWPNWLSDISDDEWCFKKRKTSDHDTRSVVKTDYRVILPRSAVGLAKQHYVAASTMIPFGTNSFPVSRTLNMYIYDLWRSYLYCFRLVVIIPILCE